MSDRGHPGHEISSVWIPTALAQAVEDEASLRGVSKSELIRKALSSEITRELDRRAVRKAAPTNDGNSG